MLHCAIVCATCFATSLRDRLRTNCRLGLLIRIKHLLPRQARLLYYNCLVLPIFYYVDIIWGDKNVVLMNSLQILQNKADNNNNTGSTPSLVSLSNFD